MKRGWMGAALAAMVALGSAGGAARAAEITRSYDFDFGFLSGPQQSIAGTFTATFDFSAGTSSLDAFSFNLPDSYLPVHLDLIAHQFVISNVCTPDGLCPVQPGQDQFAFAISAYDNGDYGGSAGAYYSATSADRYYVSYTNTITPGPVPLPASAPLFGAALLMVGGLGYARRRVGGAVAAQG